MQDMFVQKALAAESKHGPKHMHKQFLQINFSKICSKISYIIQATYIPSTTSRHYHAGIDHSKPKILNIKVIVYPTTFQKYCFLNSSQNEDIFKVVCALSLPHLGYFHHAVTKNINLVLCEYFLSNDF